MFYNHFEMNNVIKIYFRLFSFIILLCINSCYEATQNQSKNTEYSVGLKAIITDATNIYPDIGYTDCLTWHSLAVKEEVKVYKWRQRNFFPKKGDEGIIVHLTKHCDTRRPIAILKVEENYVPIETSGIKQVD